MKFVNNIAKQNVQLVISRIRKESTLINALENEGKIEIVGGIYNIETGTVEFFD